MTEPLYYFIQQLLNGLTVGSTYALIAIGYTMVYGIIGMINFAHGEVYMIGSYIAFIVLAALALLGLDSLPLMLIGAFAISMIVTSAYGFSIERVAYRPLRGGNRLIPLISAIGMSIFLQNVVRLAQGSRDIAMPSLITGGWSIGPEEGFHATLSYMQLVIFIVTFITMTALTLFISRSRMGRACRACAEDIKMTNLLGINTNNVIALTFVIGAALAAVAGVLLSLYYGVINPYIGFMAGLKAFTAAVLGGIGSIPGAVLGGLLLGVTEAITAGYFSTEYKDVVAFSLLILILLFRPTGILGRPEVEKV
ncbi:high-affinity branched-chain amino acid ABC transporter permease LivH [Pseudomonas fluvialis]|jgi:branched-chain amino acid transport system permease protein|uniref:High-affinity branched-chain amino acid ABC transporter permease LivH n=1 Tax=Pseudomonas fluvialis TaxID=1793966 RepID=A0A2I0CQL7_9PSED|nr:high-affinity branched-chain amino acid ABC transporter permease LivH [Pseudomonas pharmacofabricae]MBP7823895.1 high-affinity branched-chain amino acid ABC transporter permease LivH [Pseudomonas sp.]MBP8236769.1 high-affinity branched-chain amino acid ABC transporter permease LivH [Pseudomonas sp.]PKF71419.1 high-affinity branched-chain amino acid ABC transporter permease LivH [Pseudomonas pharmacofabricae]